MIRNSFIFLDKIGCARERRIWQSGINSWDDFTNAKGIDFISSQRKPYYDRQIEHAKNALNNYDSPYFAKALGNSEAWRLYNFFKDECCYLDIETSGFYGDITVIGMYDGNETMTMVRGFNLDKELLKKTLGNYKILVTFNGSSFDLPVINRYFKDVVPNIPHIDLRHVYRKIGWTGGLKNIERISGIKRDEEVANLNGEDAVYLWEKYRLSGDRKYLELLVKYNEEDIINLKPLAEMAVERLWKAVRFGEGY